MATRTDSTSDHWWLDKQLPRIKENTEAPSISSMTDEQIIKLAELKAQEISYKYDGKIDRCLQQLGGELRYIDFWKNYGTENGSIWIVSPKKFAIWLSERASKRLNLYTIAHELGHYFVHYIHSDISKTDKFLVATRYGEGAVERQADIFAINLLAPSHVVKRMLDAEGDIEHVSNLLCVDRYLIDQQISRFNLEY